MKKLISLMLFSSLAWAEPVTTKKQVLCDETDVVLKTLKGNNYKENPIWLGASDEKLVNYSLWVNASAKTWTIIQFNNDIACILGAGEAYTVIGKKPIT